MDRRRFLQNLAATAAAANTLGPAVADAQRAAAGAAARISRTRGPVDVEGHTVVCKFTAAAAPKAGTSRVTWTVYEDLRVRDGAVTFVGSNGESRVLTKSAEAAFAEDSAEGGVAPYLGLSLEDIGMSGRDLLAEKLLAHGDDPDPAQVKAAAPPQGSAPQTGAARGRWVTFVGTKEAFDVTPVYPAGSTRTWLPSQFFEELRAPIPNQANATGYQAGPNQRRYDGLVGGWMPATRTVIQLAPDTPGTYIEHVIFGDVRDVRPNKNKFIVRTWHRSTKIENGKIAKVVFGDTYVPYPPARKPPEAEAFYRALLAFADYWDAQITDLAPATLPDRSWVDLTSHCFAKELMIRPGGVSPKYGAVDRDYFGNEYDGFQDIFTSALYTNLEWGRFDTARLFLDDYFTNYVEPNGMIDMRGPETGQFGLTLLVLAKYFHYTRDAALIVKHLAKIEATAKVLTDLHDIALALPKDDPKHGLIQGWSESDACLHPWPHVWWQPYYANTAFAARGLKDMAGAFRMLHRSTARADDWMGRSTQLTTTLADSMRQHLRRDLDPPYVPPMPGTKLPFREAMAAERPSPLQWPHRLYAELLQPDVLPADLANLTIDTLRHYGGTILGVVANIGPARPGGKSLLGFISYGYAQMLLRLDRIEEYLLFLYSHRYHDHTRGSWTAGEVSGIRGGTSLFCIPAQQTIPLLVRWMLVLEDSDEDRLYFGKAVPREWLAKSGPPLGIERAPTKWGRVSFNLTRAADTVTARVTLATAGSPREIQVKLRTPKSSAVRRVTVNGRAATIAGPHNDTVMIQTGSDREFEVIGHLA
jgi:hypothetical protein